MIKCCGNWIVAARTRTFCRLSRKHLPENSAVSCWWPPQTRKFRVHCRLRFAFSLIWHKFGLRLLPRHIEHHFYDFAFQWSKKFSVFAVKSTREISQRRQKSLLMTKFCGLQHETWIYEVEQCFWRQKEKFFAVLAVQSWNMSSDIKRDSSEHGRKSQSRKSAKRETINSLKMTAKILSRNVRNRKFMSQ